MIDALCKCGLSFSRNKVCAIFIVALHVCIDCAAAENIIKTFNATRLDARVEFQASKAKCASPVDDSNVS